jgi:RimK family alpha-L-glutamate ligase
VSGADSRAVAIIIDAADWHAYTLRRAFATLGARARLLRLSECAFATDTRNGLAFPDAAIPEAVLVRAISAGSFEQVTRRLGVLHALRELGVPVANDARAVERCVDKSMTSFLLARAGIATPPSWTVEGRAAALRVVAGGPGPYVLKPLFGSQGRGLMLIRAPDDLPPDDAVAGVYHLQQFVRVPGAGFHDHRILVCRGEPIAAMTRRGTSWITNVRRGGKPEPYRPDRATQEMAAAAAAVVGADHAGVDIIFDRAGAPHVLEVNSMPGWRGLQSVTDLPIAEHLAAALLRAR